MLYLGVQAQTQVLDSLRKSIEAQPVDTQLVNRKLALIAFYEKTLPSQTNVPDSVKQARLRLSQEAFVLSQQLEFREGLTQASRWLCILYASLDNRYLSIQYGLRALEYAEHYLPARQVAYLHTQVAISYYKSQFYENALRYARQAFTIARNVTGSPELYPHTATLLGNVYDQLNQLDSAHKYFAIAESMYRRAGAISGLASLWVNKAELAIKEKNYAAALTLLQDAQAIVKKNGVRGVLLDATNNLTEVYLALDRLPEAYANAQAALKLAAEVKDRIEEQEAHQNMSSVCKKMGYYHEAFVHYEASVALRDVIITRNAGLATLETAVSLAKAEKQLADLTERAEHRRLDLILVGVIAIALIVITGLVFYIRYSIRQNTQLDNLVAAAQQPALILQHDTGKIMAANRLLAALGTRSLNEIVGKRIPDLDPDAARIYREWLEQLKIDRTSGNPPATSLKNTFTRTADGKVFYLAATGFNVRYRGKRAAFFLIQDETDKRLLQQEQALQREKLEQTLLALEQTRDRLLAHEKMALLGNLMAGVAHDLNTPLMTVVMLSESGSQFLPAILKLLNTHFAVLHSLIMPETVGALGQYFARAKPHSLVLNNLQQKALKQEMISHLQDAGTPQPERTASKLLLYDITQDWEVLMPIFKMDESGILTQVACELIQLQASLQNIQHAGLRTLSIVRSLRSYTHTELHANTTAINVRESLETMLSLFSHDMRRRIALHTDFDASAYVWANGDRLGQVWANLISNALYAMREKPGREKKEHEKNGGDKAVHDQGYTLTVTARLSEETVYVQVIDSGEGIPPAVMHKIFEPLFTTKEKGTGVGLGLSMCRETIEEFGGNISAESRPGHTVFTVALPAHLEPLDADVAKSSEAAHSPAGVATRTLV